MIDNNKDYQNNFRKTAKTVFYITVVLFAVLIFKLFTLQVIESQKYSTLSDKNRIRVYPVVQRRGRIISADGKVLACNRQRYRLSIESCKEDEFFKDLNLIASQISISND